MSKNLRFVVVFLILLHFCSCTRTSYIPVSTVRREVVVRRDTVVEILTPAEVYKNRTTDTVSRLYGDRAYSIAEVRGGVLSHNLSVYPRRDSLLLQWREVHTVDSVPYMIHIPGEVVEVMPKWVGRVMAILIFLILFLLFLLYRRRQSVR